MLNGMTDPVDEIVALATSRFHTAGKNYERENEDKFKDMIDFGIANARLPLGVSFLKLPLTLH